MRMRELRKEKGITMKALGEILGVAESTVSQYETGKREPDFEILLKASEYFDVSVDYLIGKVSDPHTRMATQADIDKFAGRSEAESAVFLFRKKSVYSLDFAKYASQMQVKNVLFIVLKKKPSDKTDGSFLCEWKITRGRPLRP